MEVIRIESTSTVILLSTSNTPPELLKSLANGLKEATNKTVKAYKLHNPDDIKFVIVEDAK